MVTFSDHIRDAARAEEALTLSFGSELIGMQRDWNEELQSCREFPHTTPQERCNLFSILLTVTMPIIHPIHLWLISSSPYSFAFIIFFFCY